MTATSGTRRRLAGSGAAALVLLAVTTAGAAADHQHARVNVGFVVTSAILGAAFGAVGALLVGVRPGNRLGPLLLCRDGPVISYEAAMPLLAIREL